MPKQADAARALASVTSNRSRNDEAEPARDNSLAKDLRWLFVFSVAVNLLMLAVPLHMMQVYDRVLASGSGATLFYITLFALAALVLLGIAEAVRLMVAGRMAAGWAARTAEPLFSKLIDAPGRDADGGLLRAYYAARNWLGSRPLVSLFDLPFVPFFLVLLFMLHVQIGFLTLGGMALLVALAWTERRVAGGEAEKATRANSQAVAFSQTFVSRGHDIRAMGLFPNVLRRWGAAMGLAFAHGDRATGVAATFYGLARGVRQGLQVLIVAWGAWLVLDGQLSAGVIFAASLISGRALMPVEQVVGAWDRLLEGRRAHEEVMRFVTGHEAPARAVVPAVTAGDLALERVSYAAEANGRSTRILHDVSFVLKAGEALAVIGPTGAGKSTLARLLVGAQAPTAGSVRLDDFEVTQWPDARRRQSIGYVPQDAELFPGTLADNICGFEPHPDDDAIVAAARAAQIHSHIVRLPDGYATAVSPRGSELSGGQKAQVALARAFYGRPSLVVMDEPNAHLDHDSEDAFLRTLARMKANGTTIVVVSQRRSVLRIADHIATINEGSILSFEPNRGQWRARRSDDARAHVATNSAFGDVKPEIAVGALPSTRSSTVPGGLRGSV